jgi:hypothetical protein
MVAFATSFFASLTTETSSTFPSRMTSGATAIVSFSLQ